MPEPARHSPEAEPMADGHSDPPASPERERWRAGARRVCVQNRISYSIQVGSEGKIGKELASCQGFNSIGYSIFESAAGGRYIKSRSYFIT